MNQQTAQLRPSARPTRPAPPKQFARARRHSRRIRLLKVGVPVAAVLLVIVFAVWAWWSSRDGFVAEITGAAVTDGKLVMTDARLNGFTRENLPYSLSAARAVQEIGGSGRVELAEIVARVPLDAEIWADIAADSGIYDNSNNLLDIDSAMTVTTTNGMIAHFRSAQVDVQAGSLSTEDPVRIEMRGSNLTADAMQVRERGRVVVFENRVRMTIARGLDGRDGENGE